MKISYPHKDNHFDDLNYGFVLKKPKSSYSTRRSIYCLVFNTDGEVACVQFRKEIGTMYPFPGGGVNENESWEEGLIRELKEEVGCNVKDIQPLGSFDSYGNITGRWAQNIVCSARLDGTPGKNSPAEDYEQGSRLIWLSMDKALNIMRKMTDEPEKTRDCRSYFTLKILENISGSIDN